MMESEEGSSDEDFDQAELEAALYSQTHFDTSQNDEFLPKLQTPPFSVGFHGMQTGEGQKQPTVPYGLGDFKVSVKSESSDLDGVQNINFSNLENSSFEIPLEAVGSIRIKDVRVEKEKYKKSSDINETHPIDLPKKPALSLDINSKKTAPSKDSKQKKIDPIKGHSSVNKMQNLLPFQITKKIKTAVSVTQNTQYVVVDDDVETKDNECQLQHQKSTAKHERVKEVPKIQDFLELSQPNQTKQKKIRKCDAAVKSRKPEVQIRRPPPAVPVRYRQDSDTETDYSDSGDSPMPTPTKKVKQKKPNNRDVNDVENSSASSHEDLSEKCKEAVDVNDDDDCDDDSDEEGKINNEDAKENLQDAESKNKMDQFVSGDDEIHVVQEETCDDNDEDEEEEEDEDSDASACALEGDKPVPFMPGLDFNLAGGVSKLLSGESGPKPDNSKELWKIDEKDKYNLKYLTSRYFAPRPIQCRNCRKNGHLSRDCPEPLRQRCIFCCEEGHQFKACPQAICHNCGFPGHRSSDCKEPRLDWNAPCDRCWMTGHREEMCPDRWRQLHLSVSVDNLNLHSNNKSRIESDEKKNTRKYCYNCGKKGHWGYECSLQRMNRFVPPSYPFVAYYDRKSDVIKALATHDTSTHTKSKDRARERKAKRKKDGHDKTSKHAEKKSKFKDDWGQEQNNSGMLQEDWNSKHPLNEKKDMNKRKHTRQHEDYRRNEAKNHRDGSMPKNSSKHELDRKEHRKLFPASEKDHLPSTSTHFFDTPSPKRRKRYWKDASPEVESEDSFDDMVQHQVSRNEWWLSGSETTGKHRKKVGDWRRDSAVGGRGQRNSPHGWREGGTRHSTWRDEQDIGDHPRYQQSSFQQPETTFVYVDKNPPADYHHHMPHSSNQRDHFDSAMYSHSQSHHSDHIQQYRHWDNDISPPKGVHNPRNSNNHRFGKKGKDTGRIRHSKGVHVDNQVSYGFEGNSSAEKHKGSHSKGWKSNDTPEYRPFMSKKQKTSQGPASHNRGFKSRHERFVSMKDDCDITVNLRK